MRKIFDEKGMVIVEATIVFPIMFFVIFLMIYTGNAYYQKCRIEAIVNEMAIEGAARCVDPLFDEVSTGNIPSSRNANIQPYRYLLGGMDGIEGEIEQKVRSKFDNVGSGLFPRMKPSVSNMEVKYNNGFIYSTFSVGITYKVPIPIRLPGQSENFSLKISSRVDMPVSDSVEFMRNMNMIEDYVERYFEESLEKIENMMEKAKTWLEKK